LQTSIPLLAGGAVAVGGKLLILEVLFVVLEVLVLEELPDSYVVLELEVYPPDMIVLSPETFVFSFANDWVHKRISKVKTNPLITLGRKEHL
jgi:hypothetical protein